jgi:TPR repeat protein
VPQNYTEAARWYHNAEHGVAGAQYALGYMRENGHGLSQDSVQAYLWLAASRAIGDDQKKFADSGSVDSRRNDLRADRRGAAPGMETKIGGEPETETDRVPGD